MGYPNNKYFRMSYVWDMKITSICIRDILWPGIAYSSPPGAPTALRALRRLRARVAGATALFAPSFATAIRRSSVSATDRPPRRGLSCPNCQNGVPPADLLINQGVRDNVSGHTTRAPPGRVRTDNLTVPALCHNH